MRCTLQICGFLTLTMCLSSFAAVKTPSGVSGKTGPTLKLAYNHDENSYNRVDEFMYFVPLTSPTSIITAIQSNTTLNATVTSWETEQTNGEAFVKCDFKISGEGAYTAFYDPNEMIRDCQKAEKSNPKQITELLEWIRVSGSCLGHIEGKGKVIGGTIKMEYIEVQFNDEDLVSPVEVGIYDVRRVHGAYLFKNRTNCRVARINSLKFKQCTDGSPRMSVELASIKKVDEGEGFFSKLTAMIANILSTSTPVSRIGNATMMDFGQALYHKEQAFTFPLASNFKLEL